MWEGYPIITKIINELNQWMDQKGYKSFDEIRGIALKDITTVEQLAKEPPKFADIDPSACVGCGKCKKVCMYRAIEQDGKIYKVDRNKCDGCGACQMWCPQHAAILK